MVTPASIYSAGAFCLQHDPRKLRENHQGGAIPVSDLPGLAAALQALRDPLPEQASLGDWLRTMRQPPALPELAQETSGR